MDDDTPAKASHEGSAQARPDARSWAGIREASGARSRRSQPPVDGRWRGFGHAHHGQRAGQRNKAVDGSRGDQPDGKRTVVRMEMRRLFQVICEVQRGVCVVVVIQVLNMYHLVRQLLGQRIHRITQIAKTRAQRRNMQKRRTQKDLQRQAH
mgnify:CR=1 FL=1